MWLFLGIAGALAVLLTLFGSQSRKRTVEEIAAATTYDVGRDLGQFIEVINRVQNESDPEYSEALARLRAAKELVLAQAAQVLVDDPEAPFAVRHSSLMAVAALRDPGAIDLLGRVALNPQPLPPRESPQRRLAASGQHGADDLVRGTMLALDALDGIEALAKDGHAAATEVLVRAAGVNSNAVRALALSALTQNPEWREHLQRATAQLPQELMHLAQFRRARVQDVPQVRDASAHLVRRERPSPMAPDLQEGGGGRTETTVPPQFGAPQVPRR